MDAKPEALALQGAAASAGMMFGLIFAICPCSQPTKAELQAQIRLQSEQLH
jgi:hypothetical protein